MKILYHNERKDLRSSSINPSDENNKLYCAFDPEGLKNGKLSELTYSDGFVLYEAKPQNRIFRINGNSGIFNLPYLYFGLRYYVGVDGRYIYPGVYQSGLQLYFGTEPIKSFNDIVHMIPTDPEGYVCINHRLDYTQYDSIEALSSRIIGSWYGYQHYINGFYESGLYESKEKVKYKIDWEQTVCRNKLRGKYGKLRDLLTRDKRYSREYSLGQVVISEKARIIRD